MATNLSNVTFQNVYKDDFRDSDNYHRILFNSGKALQARELTQSQTIIQKEIERFGSNIFKQGGAVNGGNLTVDNKVEYINLANNQLPVLPATLKGKYYRDSTNGVIVKILDVLVADATTNEPNGVSRAVDTLIVEYIDTSNATPGSSPIRIGAGQVLQRIVTATNTTLVNDLANYPEMTVTAGHPSSGQNISGIGTKIHISKGAFFVQGHFVFCVPQSLTVSRFQSTPNVEIGFEIKEQVVSVVDTNDLYDNQGATPNLSSPGADRYRIQLTLTTKTIAGSNNFVYLAKVVNGQVSDEVNLDNSYNQINEVLALRTKEESGNYIVKRFDINPSNIGTTDITYKVSDGIAYVEGYRLDIDQQTLTIPRAQTTQEIENESISATYGNYVLAHGDVGDSAGIKNKGIPNISNFQKINIYPAFSAGASPSGGGSTPLPIGTCRARAIYEDPTNYHQVYLFDIRMKPGQSFSKARSIGTGKGDYMNLLLEGGQAVLKGSTNNSLLFPTPKSRPQFDGITGSSLIAQKKFQITTAGSGTLTGQNGGGLPAGVNSFSGGSNWVVSEVGGNIVPAVVSNVGATFDITGLSGSTTYDVLAQVQMSGSTNVSERSKTLHETTVTDAYNADSDGRGLKFISLGKPDIFAIKAVKLTDSNGADISDNFTLDNGQRDNYYGIGRLIPKANATVPSANVFVRFQYFQHEASVVGVGGQKCYFSATSYKNNTNAVGSLDGTGVTYETIPDHTLSDGSKINLRDYLDFRPVATLQHSIDSAPGATNVIKTNGHFNITFDSNGKPYSGTDPLIHLLPQPGGLTVADITYFQPRKDRLIANPQSSGNRSSNAGEIQYLQGTPSFDPKLPNVPSGSMPLYNLTLGANTINTKDISTEPYANKRFTMADIARLERRIDNLDEMTTLSLLELNTSSLNVVDSSGNPRTKAGFLVDNFKDYSFTDVTSNEQRASIDRQGGLLAPLVRSKVNRLMYDSSDGASTATLKGDMLYLSMSDSATVFINQNLATTTENINPFAVIKSNGHIELSPSTDTWVETQFAADEVNGGGTVTQTLPTQVQFGSLAAFRDNWVGQPTAWNVGDLQSTRTNTRRSTTTSFSRTNTRSVTISGGFDTVTTQVGERVLSVSILPFMRSIKVYFRAQGLRRKTRHFPYFGGTAIDNFTKQESFARYSTRTDAGSVNAGATSHPDGFSTLTSDSNGTITGSFIIPSSNGLQFNTGTQQFKLLDISGGIDSNAISSANTSFTATGQLETRQRIFTSTRVERVQTIVEESTSQWTVRESRDPLAQSFLIDPVENPNGIFITKVRIFFASKEDNFGVPVQCQIRSVENGVPTHSPLPQAVKFLNPSQVTATALSGATMTAVQNAGTDFIFDEPIYLAPGEEYAVVLLAESTAYTVYVSETYEFVLGTTSQRIAKQPTLGSLFLSQNGSTWTPEQTKDLMFTMFRATFNTSSSAILNNIPTNNDLLVNNPIQSTTGTGNITVFHSGHGFSKGDQVTISGISGAIAGMSADSVNGSHLITNVDHTGYTFAKGGGINATASVRGGGSNVTATSNLHYNTFIPQIQTLVLNNTTISAQAKQTTSRSFGGSSPRTSGRTYAKDASYGDVILNEFNFTDNPRVLLSDSNATSAISGAKSATFKINLSTLDNKVSPIVDLQRSNLVGFENIIDKQAAATSGDQNKPLTFVDETNAVDGTHAAKHITRSVILEESAVGLKILFAANRPSSSEFKVYFRTATADEDLNTKAFTLQSEFSSNPADDDNETFREYEYLPGGTVGNLDAFTKFQIKIVMRSTNQSKVPTIKDLRVIAMVI